MNITIEKIIIFLLIFYIFIIYKKKGKLKDKKKEQIIKYLLHVNFDKNSKGELLNIIQYSLMAIIPVILLTKTANYFFPKADKKKGNFELLAEALGQLFVILLVLVIIHRLITYFSTWSGIDISSLNFPTLIMLFLVTAISWNKGKIGQKLKIVVDRIYQLPRDNYWSADVHKAAPVVKVSRPLSRLPPPIPTHQVSQADYIKTHQKINPPASAMAAAHATSLPSGGGASGGSAVNFDKMYASTHANTQDTSAFQEPMAANEALSGGFSSY